MYTCHLSRNGLHQKQADLKLAACAQYREFDGSGNNETNPQWGAALEPLLRCAPIAYADNISEPAERGTANPNPREISNLVVAEGQKRPSKQRLSDITWLFGQFLDHEIDLTRDTGAAFNIEVSAGDPSLPAGGTIPLNRSNFVEGTGTDVGNPRQQINEISSFIDATNVYGASKERADALRTFKNGLLRTEYGCDGPLPPYNYHGMPNAALHHNVPHEMYLCGDIRSNENAALTSMHTLWIREHNRLARELAQMYSCWNDEKLFQEARRVVIALMQHITFNEYLPALFGGAEAIPAYQGYNDGVNAAICNEFAACLYRLGHSMVSGQLRYEKPLSKCGGHGPVDVHYVQLDSIYFKPKYLKEHGIEGLLLGASHQVQHEIDVYIVEELRSRLFGPHAPGIVLDLAAINIQRGRDHGLPDYNTVRMAYGLASKPTIDSITSDVEVRARLKAAYGVTATPDDIDPWIGALAEEHVDSDTAVGELLLTALREQFLRLRDGDRFWFEIDASMPEWRKQEVRKTKLSHVIVRNTNLKLGTSTGFVREDVFHVPE